MHPFKWILCHIRFRVIGYPHCGDLCYDTMQPANYPELEALYFTEICFLSTFCVITQGNTILATVLINGHTPTIHTPPLTPRITVGTLLVWFVKLTGSSVNIDYMCTFATQTFPSDCLFCCTDCT